MPVVNVTRSSQGRQLEKTRGRMYEERPNTITQEKGIKFTKASPEKKKPATKTSPPSQSQPSAPSTSEEPVVLPEDPDTREVYV